MIPCPSHRARRYSLFAVALLLASAFAAAEPAAPAATPVNPAWRKLADVGVSRLFPGVEVVNGKIIVFGGFTRIGNNYRLLSEIEEFDPKTHLVSRKADMPVARAFFGSAVVGAEIYIIGGYDPAGPTARVEAYDPVNEKWTRKAPLNVARNGLRAAAAGGKIYAFGGFGELATVFEVYDIEQDTWTRLADLQQPILNPAVTVHEGKIYVVGGGIPDGTKAAGFVDVLDPVTGQWSSLGKMPVPKGDHIIGFQQGRMYVIGGWNDVVLKTIEVFDLEQKRWSTRPDLDELRFYHGGAVLDGKFYIVAGAKGDTAQASEYTNTIDLYDPALDVASAR